MKSLCLLFVSLWLGSLAYGQNKTITGKVTNKENGAPLSGVNILSDKQKGGVTTNEEGGFTISVPAASSTLVFSYVGFTSQTILIDGKTTIDVVMVANATDMNEVVVIGYGTTKKSHLTGAVSKFKNENLEETPASRLDQALQGKIAGVQIQNISSEAGSDPKVQVRGLSSINAGSSPLVVVDGHPVPDGLSFVNMADVESVEVLKDAASAAIYGSRGASGVIIITTKSGKADRPKYGVKFSTGIKTQYELYPMMTTTEYTKLLFDEAALKATDPGVPPLTPTQIIANNERAAYIVEQQIRGGVGTDWQREALRDANVKNLQVNVSGGSKTLKYFLSGGFQDDPGMMYHSEYKRYNLRAKLDANLSKRVKLSFNINPSYIKRERPSVNFIDFVRFQSFLPVYHDETTAAFVNQATAWAGIRPGDFAQARHFNARVYSGLMPDGTMWNNTAALDPFNTANNTPKSVMETRSITSNDYRVLSSGDLSINILPGLDFKTMGSVYLSYTNALDFAKRSSNRDGDVNKGIYNNRTFVDLLSENTLNYVKEFGDHSINLLAGFTAQKTMIRDEQITGLDYPSDDITTLNTALQIDQSKEATYNNKNEIGLLSWLGRAMYSYKSKYLASVSYRWDGSSYFAPGKKWGSFPAVSLGWVISEEKFLQKADWISNLKIRASYGVTGNNRVGSSYFPYLDLLYSANYPFGSGTGTPNTGLLPSSTVLANPDITWERTFQYNGGIDLSVMNNRLSFSIDVYQSRTDKLLLLQSAMGFIGVPQTWNNIGSLRNRGIEFEITSNNIRTRDFKWTTTANIAHNRNKIVELGDEAYLLNQGERTEIYMNRVGNPLIQFYGYKTDGVWLSQAQIDDARAKGLKSSLSNVFVPGGLKLVDTDGDGDIDADDRIVMGSPYPSFTWGLNNTLSYRSFDLGFMFQGVQGAKLINGDPNYNETKRYNRNYNENRWLSPMFPGDGKTPYSTVGFNWMLTDYVVEDASYYALREVILGYTLPAKVAKLAHISSARVYFSAQNLFFHSASGYRGINPEARFTSGPYATPLVDGYQRGSFPMPKTYMFGIDINF
ncbi:TonB-dependent receptor [Terrimonas sp. NA20]|uniref:TonB-dependent receptor n=1 Tax=Terrimonas ginsenosidimutans TaxID=2908004 RepID=A0ABS9L065_9BACT|nr:TonB-dependent receptor [Terrimonas ginsenosidimutans]MCG2617981.1 TonB-dependent receptor [Terrimonas ginsenosidimutans]